MRYQIHINGLSRNYDPRKTIQRAIAIRWWEAQIRRKLGSSFFKLWPRPDPLQRAKIIMTRASVRPKDYDNLVDSFRFALNIFVRFKIIQDDSPLIIETIYRQVKVPKGGGYITIQIIDLDEEQKKEEVA